MIRKRTRFFLAVLAWCLFPRPSFALENLRMAAASAVTLSTLYLQMAQREGYFKEEGFHVEVIGIRGEVAVMAAVSGEVNFFTQAGSALAAAVRGIPVKILLIAEDKPPWDLIAQPQIKSFGQLKGGTIGVLSLEGSVAVLTRQILHKNGIDPVKDVTLMVMGGNASRFLALRGRAVQATLLDPANSFQARKEGFSKLAAAGDYVSHYLGGGIVVADGRMRQAPERISKIIRVGLKGLAFFLTRRESAIGHMMNLLNLKDRDAAADIYDSTVRVTTRDGVPEEGLLQNLIEDMRKTTGVKRDIRIGDLFDFSFVRKANEELKASGWKP